MTKVNIEIDATRVIKQALLKMIVESEKPFEAPRKTERQGLHYEFLVGIGKDETAVLTMTKEAHEELMRNDR